VRAHFRFYAELNDLLPPSRRQQAFEHVFATPASVKDMIESLGVPHTEVDLVLANGRSVDFSYLVVDGDRISVYPVFESFDVGSLQRVRLEPLRQVRFVLDAHLGTLAAYLRLLGFDTLYRNDYDDAELARISSEEHRVLLSRDRGLLKRSIVTHGYCVRSTDPRRQLVEVVRRFDLFDSLRPFERCVHCNGLLQPVAKEEIFERVPPHAREIYEEYKICAGCGQIYWKGSHYPALVALIRLITGDEVIRRSSFAATVW
jgi:uncharacterized protein with PIN domain